MMFYIVNGKVAPNDPGSIDESYRSGIDVHYVKKTEMLYIGGWYDSCVGIESASIPLSMFLSRLGVTKKTLKKIIEGMEK